MGQVVLNAVFPAARMELFMPSDILMLETSPDADEPRCVAHARRASPRAVIGCDGALLAWLRRACSACRPACLYSSQRPNAPRSRDRMSGAPGAMERHLRRLRTPRPNLLGRSAPLKTDQSLAPLIPGTDALRLPDVS